MPRWLALLISYVFHPALMPAAGTAIALAFSPYHIPPEIFLYTILFVFGGTFVFPVMITYIFYKFGLVTDLHLPDAKERRWPFLAGLIFFYFTATTLKEFPLPPEVYKVVLGITVILALAMLLLRFHKMSIHMAGAGTFTATLTYMSVAYETQIIDFIALCLIVSGLIGTARLKLEAHTQTEVYSGFLVGATVAISVLVYL
jgi:membrane-associated phospholipid phosphatase